MKIRSMVVKSVLAAFFVAIQFGNVSAGFLDSTTKSIESGGSYVERKSGSRSDTKKFPIYRWNSPGLKVQVPVSYKVANKSGSSVALKSADGVTMKFDFASAKQEAGVERYKKEKDAAKEAQKADKVSRLDEKNIDNVPGFETQALLDGDKQGRREVKWHGYDADMKRYVTVTTNFGKGTYDNQAAAYDAILESVRWNYKK